MFKLIRILLLLSVLLFVTLSAFTMDASLRDWDKTKWVVVYPINVDGSQWTEEYIRTLTSDDFGAMEVFLNKEAERFNVGASQAFRIVLGGTLQEQPPSAPQGGAWFENMWWSLKLRFWANNVETGDSGPPADIKVYVEYHDPKVYEVLPHSVGMRKLSLAVVKAFASKKMKLSNHIVIAHELLHVFGASDKYDLMTNLPLYPIGYANPDIRPLFPQRKAELMAGRIPLSEDKAAMPERFRHVVISELTAKEIGWLE